MWELKENMRQSKILEYQHDTTEYRTQDQREGGLSPSPPGQDLLTARLRPTKTMF